MVGDKIEKEIGTRTVEKAIKDQNIGYGISKAEKKAYEILEKQRGAFISRRDGHIIVKVEEDGETVIIWIRQRPITNSALELFKKIIRRHEYDKLVLLKLYREADYVKYSKLDIFNEIREY